MCQCYGTSETVFHEYKLKIFLILVGELKKNEICASSPLSLLGSQWISGRVHVNNIAPPLSGSYSQKNSLPKVLIDKNSFKIRVWGDFIWGEQRDSLEVLNLEAGTPILSCLSSLKSLFVLSPPSPLLPHTLGLIFSHLRHFNYLQKDRSMVAWVQESRITKGHKKTFRDDEYIHYLDCSNGFLYIYLF